MAKVKLLRPLDGHDVGATVEYAERDALRLAERGLVTIAVDPVPEPVLEPEPVPEPVPVPEPQPEPLAKAAKKAPSRANVKAGG